VWAQETQGASIGHFCDSAPIPASPTIKAIVRGAGVGALLLAISTSGAAAHTVATPAHSVLRPVHAVRSPNVVKTPASCANTNLRPSPANLPAVEGATLCLINELRSAHHLHPLRFNADLHAVAAGQASEMVLGDYFGDDNRAGQTPLQRIVASSYPEHAARVSTAQNIGWGTGPDATPAAMVQAWTLSPPHLRIILTAGYRDIGIGIAPAAPASVTAGAYGATYTVEFGVRRVTPTPRTSVSMKPSSPAKTSGSATTSDPARTSASATGSAGHAPATGASLAGGTAG
jgi:uncharacterized protein YkwD